VALGFGALTLYSRAASGAAPVVQSDVYSLTDRFFMVCYAPVYYWSKLLLPLKLNIYYAFEKINGQFPWYYFASPALLAIVAYVAWKYRATQPYLLRGLWWYGANIAVFLPFATVGTFELCADHYNYLAGAGIFYLLLEGGTALGKRLPATAAAIKIAAAVWILGVWTLSFQQVRSWKSTLNVFTQAINNGHHLQGKMYYWRGVEYGDTGNMAAAVEDFNQAVRLDSALWDAYRFRGSLMAQSGQLEPALRDLQTYLRSDTANAPVWNNVAMINVRLNNLPEALNAFTRTIQIKPDAAVSYSNRARLYLMMGDTAKAQADLEIAKKLAEGKQK
jgi:tetratricopeptide (TPR) repeat protein